MPRLLRWNPIGLFWGPSSNLWTPFGVAPKTTAPLSHPSTPGLLLSAFPGSSWFGKVAFSDAFVLVFIL